MAFLSLTSGPQYPGYTQAIPDNSRYEHWQGYKHMNQN